MKSAAAVATQCGNLHDKQYQTFLARLQYQFMANAEIGPIFTTNANDNDALWLAYLGAFPATQRQYHTCHACREFVRLYGGLVVIDADGNTVPLLWDNLAAPQNEKKAVTAMRECVSKAKVTGVFLSSLGTYGRPITGEWRHFSVEPSQKHIYKAGALNASQAIAEKQQDYEQVVRALVEFPLSLLASALRVVESDTLYRAEKVLGPAKWLHDLSAQWHSTKGRTRTNLVWRAVAAAPAGFCHPRSSMIGTLLDDLAAGMDYDAVAKRFRDKMHPLRYQRPTAAPSDGAIDAAEKLVEKLGIAASFKRRFCRVDEVVAIWKPQAREETVGGVFAKLRTKPAGIKIDLPAGPPVTVARFRRDVLPNALAIEVKAPAIGPYCVFTTASDPDSPPILQWDSPEQRNPVAWYYWNGGSPASSHGITSGFVAASALAFMPPQWYDETAFQHVAPGVVFLLDGATETRSSGAAVFPECLRADLHGIRSAVEAHSRRSEVEGVGLPCAVGLTLRANGNTGGVVVRVTTAAGRQEYVIDRWE